MRTLLLLLSLVPAFARADDAETARKLIDSWNDGGKRVAKLRVELTSARSTRQAFLQKAARAKNLSKRSQANKQAEQVRDQIAIHDKELSKLELARAEVLASVVKLRSAEAIGYLAKDGLKDATDPALRRSVATAIARSKSAGPDVLIAALANAKKPELVVPLLQALGEKGGSATAVPTLANYLRHREWTVRVAAAFAMAATGSPDGLEPVLIRMEAADKKSREQRELVAALERYTGQKHGVYPDVWRKWFNDEKLNIAAGRVPLGKGARGVVKADQGAFYGIPQIGRAIYVVDVSGSMDVSMDNPKWIDGEAIPARDDEVSRFDAAMKELIRAMRKLHPKTTFAVVLYSSDVNPLTVKMLPAVKANRVAVERELAQTSAGGSTNIYAALDYAMRLAGAHPDSPKQKQVADAIYLLSDGSPTTSAGKTEDPQRTLLAAREWNALGKVAIHTIGIGKQHNRGFLEALAKQNGGRYYSR
jgi:hypothetical protein